MLSEISGVDSDVVHRFAGVIYFPYISTAYISTSFLAAELGRSHGHQHTNAGSFDATLPGNLSAVVQLPLFKWNLIAR